MTTNQRGTFGMSDQATFSAINPELPYTAGEAIEMLRISRVTLYSHMNKGDLRSIKIGDRRLFLGRHILEFLDLCEQRTAASERAMQERSKAVGK